MRGILMVQDVQAFDRTLRIERQNYHAVRGEPVEDRGPLQTVERFELF